MNPFDDSYRNALNTFLAEWKTRNECLGIMLVGSFATGLQTKYSDVDVYIILKEETPWRERGDKMYGDFLVEYNAHTIRFIKELIDKDKAQGKRHCLRKIATGTIQFDPTGKVKELQEEARQLMDTPLPQSRDPEWVEMSKYYMWDQIDNMRDLADRKDPGFAYAYFAGVANVVEYYAKFLGAEILRPVRMHSFFSNEEFHKKYGIVPFPDKEFAALVIECMKGAVLDKVEHLTAYVTEKMGGLQIDGWILRVPIK